MTEKAELPGNGCMVVLSVGPKITDIGRETRAVRAVSLQQKKKSNRISFIGPTDLYEGGPCVVAHYACGSIINLQRESRLEGKADGDKSMASGFSVIFVLI